MSCPIHYKEKLIYVPSGWVLVLENEIINANGSDAVKEYLTTKHTHVKDLKG